MPQACPTVPGTHGSPRHEPMGLIVTMDDATAEIYSALFVEEVGTVSTFGALIEVFANMNCRSPLYTDRRGHHFHTR